MGLQMLLDNNSCGFLAIYSILCNINLLFLADFLNPFKYKKVYINNTFRQLGCHLKICHSPSILHLLPATFITILKHSRIHQPIISHHRLCATSITASLPPPLPKLQHHLLVHEIHDSLSYDFLLLLLDHGVQNQLLEVVVVEGDSAPLALLRLEGLSVRAIERTLDLCAHFLIKIL